MFSKINIGVFFRESIAQGCPYEEKLNCFVTWVLSIE